jgi:hypothetical protein
MPVNWRLLCSVSPHHQCASQSKVYLILNVALVPSLAKVALLTCIVLMLSVVTAPNCLSSKF